ncbi:hypothetical protein [Couchioplanes caeruleus]|uniref:hypothetical protein n=1 Tax=Couchioplanes caeruleus TaxID=56438 RepID=UPI00147562A5|nr:hypothetical protein [Couchioplanes caeruleus]
MIVDETDGGSGQITAVELAGHTVEVREDPRPGHPQDAGPVYEASRQATVR